MGYRWARWLADELRAEVNRQGLDVRVIEIAGWENRGRPASTGHFDPNGAHTKHHTGATSSPSNPIPTLRTLISGRPDLPGPLAQVATAHNGDIYVIAAGRANHAGRIGKSGVAGMPLGADGNARAIGDEVDTNGTQQLPAAQIASMAVVSRVVTRHHGRPVTWVHRHADISGTGKWDIGSRTTRQLRADAQKITNPDPEAPEMNTAERQLLEQAAKDAAAARDLARRALLRGQVNSRAIVANRAESNEDFNEVLDAIAKLDAADKDL